MMNLKYRTPEEMQDSGIEWLEMIPSGWQPIRLKYLAQINPSKSEVRKSTIQCTFVPMANLHQGTMDVYEEKPIAEVYDGYTYFRDNDIIMAKVTPCYENGNIAVAEGLKNGIGFGTTEINVFRAFGIHNRFLFYRLQESHLMNFGKSHMTGVAGLQRVPTSYFENFKIAVGDAKEMVRITNFLDSKVVQFNSIISKKEKLIEKLEEAKKSLISEVVTGKVKIVDGQMVERKPEEMKDSGIEWLGYIPRNWTFRKTSHDYEIRLGKMLQTTKKRSTDTLEEYLCTINVDWAGLKLDEVKQMWFSVKDKQQYLVKNGDLIVNEGGDAGKAVMVDGLSGDMYIQNAVHRVRPKGASKAKALYYWLFFLKSIEYIELICNKATIMHFTVEKFRNLPFLGQDYFEQKRMIDLLDARVPKINSIINKQRKIIEKIKQAKQSLIYEAVTGKIDLRDWEIKQEGE